ncbi:UDP-4-amino-4,6-dideoxy-N-acetyl-beta-L-altrosamine N-acetyltransferase [Ascidiaceihabitans sp.]|nr:UDP-4-amino-4,6-dideoxy-N-acetyl-beta-L-altrosamine N-acetyltransferase [Ascidiaceihabitans sp.]
MTETIPTQLREMIDTDLLMVLEWRNHPDVQKYMYTSDEISYEDHKKWFERSLQNPKVHILIFEKDATPLGFVKISEKPDGRIGEWGFYMEPAVPRGNGLLLGQTALSYVFHNLKLHKLCGESFADNLASIRFHEKLGFTQEGFSRDQHFDGEHYRNIAYYGLLYEDWQKVQNLNKGNK